MVVLSHAVAVSWRCIPNVLLQLERSSAILPLAYACVACVKQSCCRRFLCLSVSNVCLLTLQKVAGVCCLLQTLANQDNIMEQSIQSRRVDVLKNVPGIGVQKEAVRVGTLCGTRSKA